MALGSGISTGTTAAMIGGCILVIGFIGIAAAIILSLIPSYLSSKAVAPVGEKYCIDNLRLNATFNSTYGNFTSLNASSGYLLSQSCYRILQNYYSDSLLTTCLLSNCYLTSNVTIGSVYVSPNVTCTAVIYYSSPCPDQGANSGLNNNIYSSGNSLCRKKRMTHINGALGSTSSTPFTNVPSMIVATLFFPLVSLYTVAFSTYSQLGAYYCGTITQAAITAAVNAQASG